MRQFFYISFVVLFAFSCSDRTVEKIQEVRERFYENKEEFIHLSYLLASIGQQARVESSEFRSGKEPVFVPEEAFTDNDRLEINRIMSNTGILVATTSFYNGFSARYAMYSYGLGVSGSSVAIRNIDTNDLSILKCNDVENQLAGPDQKECLLEKGWVLERS